MPLPLTAPKLHHTPFAISKVYDLEADWTTEGWPFATDSDAMPFSGIAAICFTSARRH
jgi:hypothetical protein